MEHVGIVRPIVCFVAFPKQKDSKFTIKIDNYLSHISISHLSLTVFVSLKQSGDTLLHSFLAGLQKKKEFFFLFPLLFYKSQPPIQY
jgi:hypothetical protein